MAEAPEPPDTDESVVADRVLAKLRDFVEGLPDEERAVLGALLAPGVASAYLEDADVSGFSAGTWEPGRLPEVLAQRVRDGRVRVEIE